MMHEVLEIVMPQVEDVEIAVAQIMRPFDENIDMDESCGHPFWDFYSIGGRWAGHKLIAGLDKEKLESFCAELKEKKVTVSGIQCGKIELSPESQIPMVDEMWASYFHEYKGRACPLFNHANNQYGNDCLYGDVLRLKDVPDGVTCFRFILATYDRSGENLQAETMLSKSIWNGVNHEVTAWDGSIKKALEIHSERIKRHGKEYIDRCMPNDDWIVVTVDYHW